MENWKEKELDTGELTIRITNKHIRNPYNWVMHVRELAIDTMTLLPAEASEAEAQAAAVSKVKEVLNGMLESLPQPNQGIMSESEYRARLKEIVKKAEKEKQELNKLYVSGQFLYKEGDIIDYQGLIIKVAKRGGYIGYNGMLIPTYYGPVLTKKLTPRKDGLESTAYGNENTKLIQ